MTERRKRVLFRCAFGHYADEVRWLTYNENEMQVCQRHYELLQDNAHLRARPLPDWESLPIVLEGE